LAQHDVSNPVDNRMIESTSIRGCRGVFFGLPQGCGRKSRTHCNQASMIVNVL